MQGNGRISGRFDSGAKETNLDWVDQFPLIIIELHDWLFPFQGVSRPFIKAMADREFDIVHRGENTFCFNKALLAPKQA